MGIEIHPFENFVPKGMEYLILGSFTSKDSRKGVDYDWYYSNGRNQFWPLIEKVYEVSLKDKNSKIDLFTRLGIGITDIIYKCNRTKKSSLDNVLEVIEFNPRLSDIFSKDLKAVFFSSRFVEKKFNKFFADLITKYPDTQFIYLPSPSPRYAAMSKDEKVKRYRELLPALSRNM